MLTIHAYLPQGQCDYTGRTGEAVEISSADGSFQRAVVSLAQLARMLRFQHKQHERMAEDSSGGTTPVRCAKG